MNQLKHKLEREQKRKVKKEKREEENSLCRNNVKLTFYNSNKVSQLVVHLVYIHRNASQEYPPVYDPRNISIISIRIILN